MNLGDPACYAALAADREPSPHQLRLFLVLAEELHFGRAAARLFMTQPALSRQIRTLEERLRVDLLIRTSRRAELTDAGRALVPEALAVVQAIGQFQRVAAGLAREIKGHLRLGVVGGEAAMPYTIAILAELAARHPAISVEMRNVDYIDQFDALTHGEVDASFLRSPLPLTLRTLNLAIEPRVVCLPAADPLAAHTSITLAQLSGHVFVDVVPDVPRSWWDQWAINPRPDGTSVRFGPIANDIETMLLAVARGQAITFLPAAARRLYPRPGIAYVDVVDLPDSTAALAWHPGNTSHTVLALLDCARTVLARESS
ncbi:LysR family transcriptional regulator [Herbidospora mongoliensis]|uniref:LysR family transcriptional regulator n=1 Tax=Herbidospora mongoliensis TaxID=688067 RepID=UPI0008376129|nr:LysR family transcriptional regulator [Herbidospora mongoliensis]